MLGNPTRENNERVEVEMTIEQIRKAEEAVEYFTKRVMEGGLAKEVRVEWVCNVTTVLASPFSWGETEEEKKVYDIEMETFNMFPDTSIGFELDWDDD